MGVNKRSLLMDGCDILIGTTGRMKHLLSEGDFELSTIQFLVLVSLLILKSDELYFRMKPIACWS
jgi:hypothetical protein